VRRRLAVAHDNAARSWRAAAAARHGWHEPRGAAANGAAAADAAAGNATAERYAMMPPPDPQRDAIAALLAKYQKPTQYGFGSYAKGMQGIGEALADTAPMAGLRAGMGRCLRRSR
jgi:hypothetical protein